MKTVIISLYKSYPPEYGGAVVTYDLARHLPGKKTLIQLASKAGEIMLENNLELVSVGTNQDTRLKKAISLFLSFKKIMTHVKKRNPQLIILEGASWSLYYWILFKKLKRIKGKAQIIYHAHNIEYLLRKEKNSWIVSALTKWAEGNLVRNADQVTSVSQEDADSMQDLYGRPSIPLPNGVDIHRFESISDSRVTDLRQKYGLHGKIILFMGLVVYRPNEEALKFLMDDVFPAVLKKDPKVRLVVIGGDLNKKREWIINPGIIPFEEIPGFIRACDVCVAPVFSGSGTRLKILEYMAAERPVIATTKGAEGILVTDSRDIVLADSAGSFAEKLLWLLGNPEEAKNIALNGKSLVRKSYGWEQIVKRFMSLTKAADLTMSRSKKIVIYAAGIGPTNRGIGQYALHLLPKLLPKLQKRNCRITVILSRDSRLSISLPGVELKRLPVLRDKTAKRFLLEQVFLPLWSRKADVFVSLESVLPVIPLSAKRKMTVVHDIHVIRHLNEPEKYPEDYTLQYKFWARISTKRAVKSSDLIVSVSQFSKEEIHDFYQVPLSKIVAVHNGVDHERFHVLEDNKVLERIKKKYDLPPRYYLYVGPISTKKNLALIVHAYASLKEARDFVLPVLVVGDTRRDRLYGSIHSDLKQEELKKLFLLPGFVPDSDLAALFSGAYAFIYPSFYEGFGLPVLESMACGTPVIAARSSSIPEVAGDAALLIDPADPESLLNAMEKIHTKKHYENLKRKGLERVKQFSWEKTAGQMADVITSL